MSEHELGPYRLVELIGRGDRGEVYLAFDTVRGRRVALRLLPAELAADPRYRDEFRRQAGLVARLTEPHIIPVHDFGELDERLYLDMRLVDGDHLGARLAAAGPLPPRTAVGIVAQVAAALDAAHAVGLVHRNVAPHNVLITGDAGCEFAHLADLGIVDRPGPDPGVTAPVRSVRYLPPELVDGGVRDHRVDVYALGCLLAELLTGWPPFPETDPAALIRAHRLAPPPRPSTVVPQLAADLDEVVATAMAKNPERRYGSAGEVAAAAVQALNDAEERAASSSPVAVTAEAWQQSTFVPPLPQPPQFIGLPEHASAPAAGPVRRDRRRRRLWAGLLAAAIVINLAGAGAVLLAGPPAVDPSLVTPEPRHTAGVEPFLPPIGADRDVLPPAGVGGRFAGDTQGLFGGSRGIAPCDPARLVELLAADPGKAGAWAGVRGRFAAQIPGDVARFTAVVLRSDTAVTSHGFRDGRTAAKQVVLQAGTAVLVDEFGVPTVKCGSGNPLTAPRTLADPRYVGPRWNGFAPGEVTVIAPATAPVAEFTIVDPPTGDVFTRPAGTSGNADR